MLEGCVESAESTCRAASERLDQAYADYREERDAGRAAIGTGQWSVWQDRLRYLEQQSTAAHDTWGNAIDEWAECIHTHRRLYEEQQREAGAEPDRTDVLPETEEMSTVPGAEIAHSHDLTASIGECPLCSMLDRDRIDARAALAASVQNLHMLTDKYIRQLENGGLWYGGLGEWTERLLEAGDDWSSHQSAVTNAEWRYRNAITVHSDLAAARRCEAEEMEEVPADTECPRIPLAEVKSILTKWETHYTGFRDFLAGRGLNPDGAGCAIFSIKEIRDDIDKLTTTTEEAPNA